MTIYITEVETKTMTGAMSDDVDLVILNSDTANTLTLTVHMLGKRITIRSIGAGAWTLVATSGTIVGCFSIYLAQYEEIVLDSDGVNWTKQGG